MDTQVLVLYSPMSTILALLLSLIVLEQLIEFLVRVVTWHRLLPVDTQDLVKDIKSYSRQ